jgi:Uma2 family endonuclease
MMRDDDSPKEVPMTAELLESVTLSLPYRPMTWEDLSRTPEDGRRWEIIDGSLHVSASATPWHQLVSGRLCDRLAAAAPPGVDVLTAVDVDMDANVLEPDVLAVRAEAVTPEAPRFFPADVLLVVEVESRSSRRIDRLVKPSIYAEAGIPAYWRVMLDEPETPVVTVYRLDGTTYQEVASIRAGESVVVDVPFPVELRPAELAGPRRRD